MTLAEFLMVSALAAIASLRFGRLTPFLIPLYLVVPTSAGSLLGMLSPSSTNLGLLVGLALISAIVFGVLYPGTDGRDATAIPR